MKNSERFHSNDDMMKLNSERMMIYSRWFHGQLAKNNIEWCLAYCSNVYTVFQGDIDEIEELMKSREMSYADYIQTSSDKYQSSDNQVDRNSPQPSGGLLGSLGKMFSSGKK